MEKIIKGLKKSCSNCGFNSCFREDECLGCMDNQFYEFQGLEDKFHLNADILTEVEYMKKLLKKNEPSKAIVKDSQLIDELGLEYFLHCPECDQIVGQIGEDGCFEYWANYCPQCGQHIENKRPINADILESEE